MNLLKLTLCLVNKVWHPTWMSFFSRDAMDRNFILHTMNHEYSKQARKKERKGCFHVLHIVLDDLSSYPLENNHLSCLFLCLYC